MNLIRTFGGDPRWCFAQVLQNGHGLTKADVTEGAEALGLLAGDQVAAMYGLDQGVTAYFGTQRGAAAVSRASHCRFSELRHSRNHQRLSPDRPLPRRSAWSPGRSAASMASCEHSRESASLKRCRIRLSCRQHRGREGLVGGR